MPMPVSWMVRLCSALLGMIMIFSSFSASSTEASVRLV